MSTDDELRAAIGTADRLLGHTRAAEGQAPAHVLPVPAPAAADDAQPFTDDDVAAWSSKLGFAGRAKSGRVTQAKD
jgi:hypothetical protein